MLVRDQYCSHANDPSAFSLDGNKLETFQDIIVRNPSLCKFRYSEQGKASDCTFIDCKNIISSYKGFFCLPFGNLRLNRKFLTPCCLAALFHFLHLLSLPSSFSIHSSLTLLVQDPVHKKTQIPSHSWNNRTFCLLGGGMFSNSKNTPETEPRVPQSDAGPLDRFMFCT